MKEKYGKLVQEKAIKNVKTIKNLFRVSIETRNSQLVSRVSSRD